MFYIFYNPRNNNEIKGYATDPKSMQFPYVEAKTEPALLWNFKVENGELKAIRNQFTEEEWDIIMTKGKL